MVKIIYFNLAALAVLLMVIASACTKRMLYSRANRAFIVVLIEVLITTLFDIGAVHFDNLGAGNVAAKYFFHGGYLIFHTASALFYLKYLISLTDTDYQFRKHKLYAVILYAPMVIYMIVFITGFLGGPKVFYINENDTYTRGPGLTVGYLVGAYYMIYGAYYIIKYRRLFTPTWIVTLFSPYPFLAVAMIVEFFYPQYIIELFFNALAMMFIYSSIQKPSEMLDHVTGFGNQQAFEASMRRTYLNGKTVNIMMADILEKSALRAILGFDNYRLMRKEMAMEIQGINKELGLFAEMYADGAEFFLIVEEDKTTNVNVAAGRIYDALKRTRRIAGKTISPIITMLNFTAPEDVPDFDSMIKLTHNHDLGRYNGKLMNLSDMDEGEAGAILLNLSSIISDAITNNHLEVFYQPIYSTKKKCFDSAEALIRLKDPKYGFVSPDLFIPVAEKNGEIWRIWDFVIEEVCNFVGSQEFRSLGLDYIEINLSAVQCMQENFADRILADFERYEVDKKRINLEVTETAAAYNPEILIQNLNRLVDEGIDISLDDYGTGYSDTRRVMEMPIKIAKLDKTFINVGDNVKMNKVLESTIRLLKDIEIEIVAEGIEDEETLRNLEALGCDYIQGYYFSRPVPKDEFVEFIEAHNHKEDA